MIRRRTLGRGWPPLSRVLSLLLVISVYPSFAICRLDRSVKMTVCFFMIRRISFFLLDGGKESKMIPESFFDETEKD